MTATAQAPEHDRFDPERATGAVGLLREFNDAGILAAADVHVATRLSRLVGEQSEMVLLAAALAVRGPRLGHVFVDLAAIPQTASVESEEPADLEALPWPEAERWIAATARSELVAVGEDEPRIDRPLRLLASRLYLDRYWREERGVAADLLALGSGVLDVSDRQLADGLRALSASEWDVRQREAATTAVRRRLSVIAGGPGTGKTTTVARIVALLACVAAARGSRLPLVALAAPTGKAAARLQEAVHEETGKLPVSEEIRALLMSLRSSTLHRLLGWRPGSHSRFLHDRGNHLPHDLVIVDETSMVSLSLMARLVEAVRPDGRLILVGDPGQLASIEAGVVLGDIVSPAPHAPHAPHAAAAPNIGAGIVVLERVHRYGGGIARVAEAIREGDGDATLRALTQTPEEVTWLPLDVGETSVESELRIVRETAVAAGRGVLLAARAGAGGEALTALSRFRLLCAHRRGPYGVSDWSSRVQGWLTEEIDDLELEQRDYVGRPLLVTENDYELGLYNGDTGVIVQSSDGLLSAVFERGRELLALSPLRLGAVETVYAMTIHKSQGSQFDVAAVVLPPASSRLLTRELLYTAVTRARRSLIVCGTEAAVRTAVARPVGRASGLRERLWEGARRS